MLEPRHVIRRWNPPLLRFKRGLRAVRRWWWSRYNGPVTGPVSAIGGPFYFAFMDGFLDHYYENLFEGIPILPDLAWLWGAFTFVELILLPYRLPAWIWHWLERPERPHRPAP